MKNFRVKFIDKFTDNQMQVIEDVVEGEMELLFGYYEERDVVLEFMSFYVENEFLRFSAASDEPRKMWFKINTYIKDLEGMIREYLPETIAHEFHHMIRWNFTKRYHLAELMVMEGLAMHFVMEIKGSRKPRFIRDISEEEISRLMPPIKRDLFNEAFNNRIWQRGSKEDGIPPYFAYSLGFKLVGEYLAKHKEKKASNCFDLDCREVVSCL